MLPHSREKKNFMFEVCYVSSEFSKHIPVNENLFVSALTGIVYSNLLYLLVGYFWLLGFKIFSGHLHSYVRLMITNEFEICI